MSLTIHPEGASDTPQPPFIEVAGIPNFRDVGGYKVASPENHSIRREVIYRCGEPSQVTKDGVDTMKRLGITHIYDLRSIPEIERNKAAGRGGIVEWEGCERVFVPVFKDQDYSPEALATRLQDYADGGPEGFTRAYTDILNNAPPSYKTILMHLANEPEKPLIVHCTAGKDRTGVICALVLSLCGVDDEVVAHEYSLTEVGLTTEWKEAVLEHLSHNPALKGNPEGAKNLISAKAANMLATLKMINENFGGAEGYIINKCGLTKTDVEKIRKNLIVEKPAIHEKV
ncbi:related to protein-tyrosine phosphatase [Phialocephala subalpina]|uniref:Related to protein-tyrosine phosphatase n=1 Tax=Phialocephala subalpina TaxID=576137 RepID=A0A1L7XD14_9HELO|nr:related to protein-tyrosine phosphatase [Phialocephala subalpina]